MNVYQITVEPHAGCHIRGAAKDAIAIARVFAPAFVVLAFNNVDIEVVPDDTPESVDVKYTTLRKE